METHKSEVLAIRVLPSVVSSALHVYAHQNGYGEPHHGDQEEERVANVPSRVCNQSHKERAHEGTRLQREQS